MMLKEQNRHLQTSKIKMWFAIFVLSVFAYAQADSWDNVTANIVVVEFQRITNDSLSEEEVVNANVKKYLDIFKQVTSNLTSNTKLDLIIFPEGSLKVNYETAVEITINDNPSTSDDYPQYIKILSGAAKNYSTYLVTNLVEKVKCENQSTSTSTNCKERGNYYYNTDIIFDRTGKIINKYHKLNLFGEQNRDRAPESEVITIETDFGINFGIFTCFDILFKHPAEDVVEKKVDGILYPTNWHAELPFLTALQAQQMWAYAHKTTIFAAGGSYPVESSGGTAIYRGSLGTVANDVVAKGGDTFLIYSSENGKVATASSPTIEEIDSLAKEMDVFPLIQDNSLKNYTSKSVDLQATEINEIVCSGEDPNDKLCCNFYIKKTNSTNNTSNFYVYQMVAYKGIRVYPGIGAGGFEICGVIACQNTTITSCGTRLSNTVEWPQYFENITITADFEINENKAQFPNTLLSSIRPIDASFTSWSEEEVKLEDGKTVMRRTFSTKEQQKRLLTFAIFGRDFSQDVLPEAGGNNSAVSEGPTFLLFSILLIVSHFYL